MNRRQWIWASLCGLTLVTFFGLIPLDTYDAHSMFFSFAGAILFGVTLFFMLGDFTTLQEIVSKIPPGTPENAMRKLSPFAVIPTFILIFVLVFHHSGRKKEELSKNGTLTKGTVTGGEATETTRRFRTNTSYSLVISYKDSLGVKHTFDQSVNSSDFNNVYEGAPVDVIYSKKLPALASALFSVQELSKYRTVPVGDITITNLVAILEGSVKPDSILQYLNSINYEWVVSGDGVYVNNKLNLAIKVFPGNTEIAYVEQANLFSSAGSEFESTLTDNGFKKKSTSVEGQPDETYYYNEKFVVSKERSVSESNGNSNALYSSTVTMIYRVVVQESIE